MLGLLLTMIGQHQGFPVPEGGAGELSAALARRFEALGGQIRCGVRVDEVLVDRRTARGVLTSEGERIDARAVIADVSAPALYGGLVDWSDLPPRTRTAMSRFELDPATIKVDWALSGPVPWSSPPAVSPGTIHISDSVEQMSEAQAAIISHQIPAEPFILAGQMSTTDPTRSPSGTESFWAYTHVPQQAKDDQGPDGLTGRWNHDEIERMADRMQRRIEEYAPGLQLQDHLAADPRPAGTAESQRESDQRSARRRHLQPAPAVDLPAGPGTQPGGDADPRSVPRLGVGASRWCGARRVRGQCRARDPGRGPPRADLTKGRVP